MPENLYMGLDEVLRLGHLTLAVDQLSDRPKSRTGGGSRSCHGHVQPDLAVKHVP